MSVTITGAAKKIGDAEELLTLLVPSRSGPLGEEKTRLVIVDTNVLLHNLDVLEHSSFAISNLVIPQTALLECRHRSFTAYNRVMELLRSSSSKTKGDKGPTNKRCAIFFPDNHHISTQLSGVEEKKTSINDENDARIRQVALYYGEALSGSGVEVILLSDDKGCRELAVQEQRESLEEDEDVTDIDSQSNLLYRPKSVRDHIKELENDDPDLSLSDLVAQLSTTLSEDTTKKKYFSSHLLQSELSVGVKSGKYFQGFIRAERGAHDKCYVTVRQGGDRVAVNIIGSKDINRAVEGDVVAIELHPVHKWLGGNEDDEKNKKVSTATGIAAETAEPSIRDENNITDSVELPNDGSDDVAMRKPTGKVVGIIRRNFRTNYCGSIFTFDDSEKDSKEGGMSEREQIASKYEVEHPDGTTTCAFFPVAATVPPVLVRTTHRERLLGKRILIAIDSWPADSPFPLGHYVKTMGDTGSKDVETEVLLHEHNIPCDPFPAKVSNLDRSGPI